MTDVARTIEASLSAAQTPVAAMTFATPGYDAPASAAHSNRLRLQSGVGALAIVAMIAGVIYLSARPQSTARIAPPILSSGTLRPIQQVAETVRTGEPISQNLIEHSRLDEAPAISVAARSPEPRETTAGGSQSQSFASVLTTKVVKTIVIRPNGDPAEESSVDDREARSVHLRQALSTTTPSAVSASTPSVAELSRASAPASPAALQRVAIAPAAAPTVADMIVTNSIPPARSVAWAAPVASASGYYVQLAASMSHDEARLKADKLQARLANNLGTRELAIYQGIVKDKTVYRVRVATASRDEANQLCSSLKGVNAECFVARE